MGVMWPIEKFVVNRFNKYLIKRSLDDVSAYVEISSQASCLEVGAGRGFLSYLVYEKYHPKIIVVTDYDPLQVDEAKEYFRENLVNLPDNVQFRAADAMNLPFEDESFDAVLGSVVLHHVERRFWDFKNIPIALDEIRRVLKHEGIFGYGEVVNKDAIRDYLNSHGFQEVFARRYWKLLDLCVYRKSS